MSKLVRPPELQLEGCTIRTSYGTGGRVIEVCARHDTGGWTIVYEDLREGIAGDRTRWINEVFVENGTIYSHPWRDVIEVVEVGQGQTQMF